MVPGLPAVAAQAREASLACSGSGRYSSLLLDHLQLGIRRSLLQCFSATARKAYVLIYRPLLLPLFSTNFVIFEPRSACEGVTWAAGSAVLISGQPVRQL